MAKIGIGLVGYYQFVRGYPIGPTLKELIEKANWSDNIEIKEMNWGPIAIVQEFQAEKIKYDRFLLITAIDRGMPLGSVTCRRWVGGAIDVLSIQERIFEAVTGVISMDNLLVIGEHFGIWPKEVVTIEAQLADTAMGDLVMSEMAIDKQNGKISVIGSNPLSSEMELLVNKLFAQVEMLVTNSIKATNLKHLGVKQLNTLTDVCHNRFMENCKTLTN